MEFLWRIKAARVARTAGWNMSRMRYRKEIELEERTEPDSSSSAADAPSDTEAEIQRNDDRSSNSEDGNDQPFQAVVPSVSAHISERSPTLITPLTSNRSSASASQPCMIIMQHCPGVPVDGDKSAEGFPDRANDELRSSVCFPLDDTESRKCSVRSQMVVGPNQTLHQVAAFEADNEDAFCLVREAECFSQLRSQLMTLELLSLEVANAGPFGVSLFDTCEREIPNWARVTGSAEEEDDLWWDPYESVNFGPQDSVELAELFELTEEDLDEILGESIRQ